MVPLSTLVSGVSIKWILERAYVIVGPLIGMISMPTGPTLYRSFSFEMRLLSERVALSKVSLEHIRLVSENWDRNTWYITRLWMLRLLQWPFWSWRLCGNRYCLRTGCHFIGKYKGLEVTILRV